MFHVGSHLKTLILARHLWLMPIILATEEAGIRRIRFKASQAKSLEDPILKIPNTKQGWW
jgi:hypothetical protein